MCILRNKQKTAVEGCRRRYSFVQCLWYQMEKYRIRCIRCWYIPKKEEKLTNVIPNISLFKAFKFILMWDSQLRNQNFSSSILNKFELWNKRSVTHDIEQFRRIVFKPVNLYLLVDMLLFSVSCKHVLLHVFLWRRSFEKVLVRGGGCAILRKYRSSVYIFHNGTATSPLPSFL